MTATADTKDTSSSARKSWRYADEPWPIWAAILVFLNILVISGKVWGLAGLVSVAVPAAIGMLILLLLIVRG